MFSNSLGLGYPRLLGYPSSCSECERGPITMAHALVRNYFLAAGAGAAGAAAAGGAAAGGAAAGGAAAGGAAAGGVAAGVAAAGGGAAEPAPP